jgi:nucleoside-diphosphate-sugar epimerase
MKSIVITGSDGYVGGRLVRTLLESSAFPVIAWLRAASAEEREAKRQRLKAIIGDAIDHPRLRIAAGDLRDAEPFREIDPREVGILIHSASITRFNVEEDLAREVNFEGALKLFAFAEKCPGLDKLLYLSTVYASGLRSGEIPEQRLDGAPGFANFYERSKWQSEEALISRFDSLPWTIARIATIIADDDAGAVTQYNVVHNTLKLLYYGLISLVPGEANVPLYFVTGDFIVHSIAELALGGAPSRNIYHLVHRAEESLTVGRLLDCVYEVFNEDPAFQSRRVLRPLLCDWESFELLASQMNQFSGGVVQQAVQSIQPFAKQLFVAKRFHNERAAGLASYRAPDPVALTRNTARQLVASRWGRK